MRSARIRRRLCRGAKSAPARTIAPSCPASTRGATCKWHPHDGRLRLSQSLGQGANCVFLNRGSPKALQMRIGGERGSVNRKWFNELLQSQGFGSQKAFAAAIGLDGPKLTNLLTGKRRPQISELTEMSRALNTSMVTLM